MQKRGYGWLCLNRVCDAALDRHQAHWNDSQPRRMIACHGCSDAHAYTICIAYPSPVRRLARWNRGNYTEMERSCPFRGQDRGPNSRVRIPLYPSRSPVPDRLCRASHPQPRKVSRPLTRLPFFRGVYHPKKQTLSLGSKLLLPWVRTSEV